MPCKSYYDHDEEYPTYTQLEMERVNKDYINSKISNKNLQRMIEDQTSKIDFLNKYLEIYKKELDNVTKFLCKSMNILEKNSLLCSLTGEHIQWYEKHKLFDEKRNK